MQRDGPDGWDGGMSTGRARTLRKEMTEAERRLWQKLQRRQLDGVKFRRQQPIGPFIWNNEVLAQTDAVTQAILDCVRERS